MSEFWLISYIIAAFGSISFGYFLLRYGLPDIRMLPRQTKFGLSGFAGMLMFGISAGVAYFAFTPMHLYVILPAVAFVGTFFIEINNRVRGPTTIKVAIPVARVKVPKKGEKKEAKEEKKPEKKGWRESREKHRKEREEAKEAPEVFPEKEKEEIKQARRERRMTRRAKEIGEEPIPTREEVAKAKEKEEKPRRGRRARPEPKKKEKGMSRRDRYLRRRGEYVEQAKADMMKPVGAAMPLPTEEMAPLPEFSEDIGLEITEGLDLSDLETLGDLGELSIETGLGELEDIDIELDELAGLSEIEELPKEKAMGCPHCKKKRPSSIVYCPYCGKGFCSDCSSKIKRDGQLIFYKCPVCEKEVIVKAEG